MKKIGIVVQKCIFLRPEKGIIKVSVKAPEGWGNNKIVNIFLICNDYVQDGNKNIVIESKIVKKREKIIFDTNVKNGKVEFNLPVPKSWYPLPKVKHQYIYVKMTCPEATKIIYKDYFEECPLYDKPTYELFSESEDIWDNIKYSVRCLECDREFNIIEETRKI